MDPLRTRGGRILGWGIDRQPADRPGVPRERLPPELLAHPPVLLPPRTQPPRGLSGALRRMAHRIPGHRARRWALLLLADRLDWLEHGAGRSRLLAGAALAAVAGTGLVLGWRTRRRPRGVIARLRGR